MIRLFSYYVSYIGGINAYAPFLDQAFACILQTLLSDSLDADLRMQCIIIEVYIYMLNVVTRNVTKIRIDKKEMFSSNIEMLLQAENQVTADQCRAFRDKMTSSNDLQLYVNHFQDFVNEIKNAMEGGGSAERVRCRVDQGEAADQRAASGQAPSVEAEAEPKPESGQARLEAEAGQPQEGEEEPTPAGAARLEQYF